MAALGVLVIASPLLAMFVWTIWDGGLQIALTAFAITACIAIIVFGTTFLGLHLMGVIH